MGPGGPNASSPVGAKISRSGASPGEAGRQYDVADEAAPGRGTTISLGISPRRAESTPADVTDTPPAGPGPSGGWLARYGTPEFSPVSGPRAGVRTAERLAWTGRPVPLRRL